MATVKANPALTAPIDNRFYPERARWKAAPLSVLIGFSYGIQSNQIVGGPSWITADRWDVEAKSEGPTTMLQKKEMLQSLIEQRFQFQFHWEDRQLPAFILSIAKGGLKIHPTRGVVDPATAGVRIGRGLIQGTAVSMTELASFLQGETGLPVRNDTGLAGKFDCKLEWVPDERQPGFRYDRDAANDPGGASIFEAIQEQLGLKLTGIKASRRVMVIDRASKPAGN